MKEKEEEKGEEEGGREGGLSDPYDILAVQ